MITCKLAKFSSWYIFSPLCSASGGFLSLLFVQASFTAFLTRTLFKFTLCICVFYSFVFFCCLPSPASDCLVFLFCCASFTAFLTRTLFKFTLCICVFYSFVFFCCLPSKRQTVSFSYFVVLAGYPELRTPIAYSRCSTKRLWMVQYASEYFADLY